MGFTPLDGVPMGTRPGSVDPGVLLHLLRRGVSTDELASALEHESGLRGLAGTSDVAELLATRRQRLLGYGKFKESAAA